MTAMNSHSILSGPGFELGQTLSRRRRHGRGSRRRAGGARTAAAWAWRRMLPLPHSHGAHSHAAVRARDSAFALRICLRGCSAQFQGNERSWVSLIDFRTYDASNDVSHFLIFCDGQWPLVITKILQKSRG